MKRWHILTAVFLVLAVVSAPQALAARGRAVSLKQLQASVRAGNSQSVYNLCGITRLDGYVLDRDSRDVVVYGVVDPNLPALRLDDFVVALRAAKLVYGRREGRTIYYSAPGCSIDPNPDTLRRLQGVAHELRGILVPRNDVDPLSAQLGRKHQP